MPNPSKAYRYREILNNEEIDLMIEKADSLKIPYFQLRAKALVSLFKKFGKRRIENSRLMLSDLNQTPERLDITFTVAKKHKKGFFQYLKFLEKESPEDLNKPHNELKKAWLAWAETPEGHRTKEYKSVKGASLEDRYIQNIIAYRDFLKVHYPENKFLFPSGRDVFGHYIIIPERHLSGRTLLRIIRQLSKTAWCHLFRETKGAEIARARGRNITTVFEVKDTLDLEKEETAYRYVRRYATQVMPTEK